MKNTPIINPTTPKGYEFTERIKSLMGDTTPTKNDKNSSIELTKLGPDGNVYGIVRENHDYYIKIASTGKKNNLSVDDFSYMGGLQNKREFVYPSYAKALKKLNLKFISLNEALGKNIQTNILIDDNLLTEHHPYKANQPLTPNKGVGDAEEYVIDDIEERIDDCAVLSELEQHIDNMVDDDPVGDFTSCSACDGNGTDDVSDCCGAPMASWSSDNICSQCGEHADYAECYECGGSGLESVIQNFDNYKFLDGDLTNISEEDKNNPWAICTKSVGRDDYRKYEACVRQVKDSLNISENVIMDHIISEAELALVDLKKKL